MKVLIAGPDSVHVASYCKALKPHVSEIILLTETECNIKEVDKKYCISFRGLNIVAFYKKIIEIRKVIKIENPDIIHVHQINRLAYFIALAIKNIKVPLMATAWGSDVLLVPNRNALVKKMTATVLNRANAVTADSGQMLAAINRIAPAQNKHHLLQYGIDPVVSGVKEKIIYSNRLHEPIYNIDEIVRDFSSFVKKNKEWKLIIAGNGSLTNALKMLCSKLGLPAEKVEFVGWLNQDRNRHFYAISQIYASFPTSDGTSVSLLEAMSAGCVPVVSNLPVSKEWITDGINGIIKKEGVNPFEEAIRLDSEKCHSINSSLVDLRASRERSILKFMDLYKYLVMRSI